mgnify:CR=1 FL=1
MSNVKVGSDPIYDARSIGVPRMLVLGVQHMFAMFGATVLVPALTGLSVSATLLFAGLGTLLFHLITKKKVPAFLGSSFAFLGGFIGLAVSPDPLYYGILPVLIEVCGNYGIPATSVAIAFGVGADSCFTMAPVIASTYLGLAVSGMSLKDVMKTNFLPHWIIGLIMIVFGCLIGTIVV